MSTTKQTEEEEYPFTIELDKPFEYGDVLLTTLRFREPVGEDLMRSNVKFGGGSLDFADMMQVASLVSPYGLTLFQRLPARAVWDVATLMGKSLDGALQTGPKSSEQLQPSSETQEVG
jgi:hypothetical protein